MAIDRRSFLGLGLGGLTTLSASLITGIQGCSSKTNSLLIGGYQESGGQAPGGQFGIGAISQSAQLAWKTPTDTRVHGLASHPTLPIAAVAARRPGRFILLFNPLTGERLNQLDCPEHAFIEGHVEIIGNQLLATAATNDTSQGLLLSWNLSNPTSSPDRISLAGLGPHQLVRGEGSQLWIAMGGWKTQQRKVLNADTFESFILNLDINTGESTRYENPDNALSLRHISYSNGELFAAMQYPTPHPSARPLVYRLKNKNWTPVSAPDSGWEPFRGYIASLACNQDSLVATSPQGHQIGVWDCKTLESISTKSMLDVAGAANIEGELMVSAGTGLVTAPVSQKEVKRSELHWDNHWISHSS